MSDVVWCGLIDDLSDIIRTSLSLPSYRKGREREIGGERGREGEERKRVREGERGREREG